MKRPELTERYNAQALEYTGLAEKEGKTLLMLSFLRLITFIGGLILAWFGFRFSAISGIILLVLSIVLFLVLLKRYSVHLKKKDFYQNLARINSDESKAINGDYSMFGNGADFAGRDHDFSYDLDLFGESSLFQYLNRTCTGYGREKLASWLSDPLSVAGFLDERQMAVADLAAREKWRQSFLASGMNKSLEKEQISGLTKWLSKENPANSSLTGRLIIVVMPALAILSLILAATGLLHYSVFILVVLVNSLIIFFNLRKTSAIHEELTGKYSFLDSMGELLSYIEEESFDSTLLNTMKSGTISGPGSAVASIRKLGRIIRAFDSRLNILAAMVLNGMFLWDLRCIRRLEKWKAENREQFPVWLEMIGQTDAYISLGNYAWNNSDFIFPVISKEGYPFSAKGLGHQLIDPDKRVCNDFTVQRKGDICIITGANMAGKSTFLRSVAVNLILAMAGAPVCASELCFTPVRLFTSMRTTDSLSSGESYFYAELKRLRFLEEKISSGEDIFFILDEILKGTNSDDKAQGSRLFLDHIIKLGGTGLVATHDTSLGYMERDHPEVIENKCFEVEIDGENIIFDYKLRNGIASRKNAVLLMKQMGII